MAAPPRVHPVDPEHPSPRSLASALAWAADELDHHDLVARSVGRGHGGSQVFDLRRAGAPGPLAFLKLYPQPRKQRQEHRALTEWCPLVGSAPALVAARAGPPPAVLLGPVPGRSVLTLDDDDPRLPAVHEAAGAWLRRLHAIVLGDDRMPLAVALERRLDASASLAGAVVPIETTTWLRDRLAALDLAGTRRVACHADYGPRNWLWDDAYGLSVIDFEHARADLWAVDVHTLIDGPWRARPALAAAFWHGYGCAPDAAEAEVIAAMRGLYALGTVVWARAHGDAAFERDGWAILARLGAPGLEPSLVTTA